MKPVARQHVCDFCASELADTELLFRSDIGGIPSAICAGCVTDFSAIVEANRKSPALAASLVEARNAMADAARKGAA